MTHRMIPCPVDRCPTPLQAKLSPPVDELTPLEAGVYTHLSIVHQLELDEAARIAKRHVAIVRGGSAR